jgi:plastocyanin
MRAVVAGGLALMAGGVGWGAAGAAESTNVVVKGLTYAPPSVEVAPGGKVIWTFDDGDTPHTVTAEDNSFRTPPNGQKSGTFEWVFDKAGSFNYRCEFHENMIGTVNVR